MYVPSPSITTEQRARVEAVFERAAEQAKESAARLKAYHEAGDAVRTAIHYFGRHNSIRNGGELMSSLMDRAIAYQGFRENRT